MTEQGTTARWPLPDLRTDTQRADDRPVVREQVRVLSPSTAGTRAAGVNVVERIRQRQIAAGGNGTKFVVHEPDDGGTPALVVENGLVVETEQQQLTSFGTSFADYEGTPRTGRRTRAFRGKGKAVKDLLADAKQLRDKQVKANVNLIVPLGYVVKGDEFPGRTSVQKTFAAGSGGSPVRVAVIDTGLTDETRTDAWFTGIKRNGTDKLDQVDPKDRNDYFAGHGSFTAGIVRQLSPTCEIVVYRFTKTDGVGTEVDAADMLVRAADEGAGQRLIINASFGAPAVDSVPPLALQEAVDHIAQQYPQVLIVASAGNDGSEQPLYPAAFKKPGVRAVGALNPDLTGAAFSNRGDWVHCSAVGVGVVSTFVKGLTPPDTNLGVPDIDFPTNAWATWTGTSFTAPQISGAVACLCADDATLQPQAAFDRLVLGRPKLPKFGTVVHLLQGTPVA